MADPRSTLRYGLPGPQLPLGRRLMTAAGAAEQQGADSIWYADRLMGWLPQGPHNLLDPVPLIATAAAATERIMLGTAVIDPLRRHPAQMAQTALSLQHLSEGRLVLGLGCGEAAGSQPYGLRFDRPVSRLEEALQVMHLLWSQPEPVSFAGSFYELDQAICGLTGDVARPPVWLAAHGPRTLGLTGRHADGWLPTAHGPHAYQSQLATIHAAARDAGRPSEDVESGAFVWLIAASSRQRARELMATPSLRALGLLLPQGALSTTPMPDGPWAHLVPTKTDVAGLAEGIDVDELSTVIPHGNPDDIANDVEPYVRAGARHLVLCDMAPFAGEPTGLDQRPGDVVASIRARLEELTGDQPSGSGAAQ